MHDATETTEPVAMSILGKQGRLLSGVVFNTEKTLLNVIGIVCSSW